MDTPTAAQPSQSPVIALPLQLLAPQPGAPVKITQVSFVVQHYEAKTNGLNFDPTTFIDDDEEDDDMEAVITKVSKQAIMDSSPAPTPTVAASTNLSPSTIEKLQALVDALEQNSDALLEDPSPIHNTFAAIEETLPPEVNQAILAACELDKMKVDVDVAKDRLARGVAQKTLQDELAALIADANNHHEEYMKLVATSDVAKSTFGAAVVKVADLEKALEEAKADRDQKLTRSKEATTSMNKKRSIVKTCGDAMIAHREKLVEVPGTEEDDNKF